MQLDQEFAVRIEYREDGRRQSRAEVFDDDLGYALSRALTMLLRGDNNCIAAYTLPAKTEVVAMLILQAYEGQASDAEPFPGYNEALERWVEMANVLINRLHEVRQHGDDVPREP